MSTFPLIRKSGILGHGPWQVSVNAKMLALNPLQTHAGTISTANSRNQRKAKQLCTSKTCFTQTKMLLTQHQRQPLIYMWAPHTLLFVGPKCTHTTTCICVWIVVCVALLLLKWLMPDLHRPHKAE